MSEQDLKELNFIVDIINKTVQTEEIYLFGSFAYGTPNNDSDFDIYIVLPDDSERPLRAVQKINLALARYDIRAVDIIAGIKRQFYENCEAPTLERTIMLRGVRLYERRKQLYQTMA